MNITIIGSIIGFFAYENEEKKDEFFFSRDVDNAIQILSKLKNSEIPDDFLTFLKRLEKKGYKEFFFDSIDISATIKKRLVLNTKIISPNDSKKINFNLEKTAIESGYFKNTEDLYNYIQKVCIGLSKKDIKQISSEKDLSLTQAIMILDDLDMIINNLSNRIHEWYGYYFPELEMYIEDNLVYLKLIKSIKKRNNFTKQRLSKESIENIDQIACAVSSSMGAFFNEDDLRVINSITNSILKLYNQRKKIETYIDKKMKKIAPNIKSLVGSTLGARLIAKVGGLENLSKKPASTIQILGAEKALFRSFRNRTKKPKHGLIFQHMDIRNAPLKYRGKIARTLSSKLAIASRLDAYGKKRVKNTLLENFKKRVEEILNSNRDGDKEIDGNQTS